ALPIYPRRPRRSSDTRAATGTRRATERVSSRPQPASCDCCRLNTAKCRRRRYFLLSHCAVNTHCGIGSSWYLGTRASRQDEKHSTSSHASLGCWARNTHRRLVWWGRRHGVRTVWRYPADSVLDRGRRARQAGGINGDYTLSYPLATLLPIVRYYSLAR